MSQNYFANDIYKYDNIRKKNIKYDLDYQCDDFLFSKILTNNMPNIFGKRFGHQITEYANRLFLIGGTEIKKQNTGATFFDVMNDIWYSFDCFKWKKIEIDSNWEIIDYYQGNNNIQINTKKFQFPKLTNFQVISTINGMYIIGGIVKDTWDGITPNRKNKYIFDSDSPFMKLKAISSNINKLIIKLELNGDKLKPSIITTNFTSITNITNHKCIQFNGLIYLFDYNSVWYSRDFVYWYNLIPIRINSAYNQFSYRRDYGIVALNKKLYVLGGNTGDKVLNDIWESSDGISWKQIVKEAEWDPRCSFCCCNFKTNVNKQNDGIESVVICCGKNYQKNNDELIAMSYGDIWWSNDMIKWNKSNMSVLNRNEAACSMFSTRSLIIGGKYDSMLEYCSDTWAVDAYNDIFAYGQVPEEDLFIIKPVVGSVLVGGMPVGGITCTWSQYQNLYKYLIRDGSGVRSWSESPNKQKTVDMGEINYRPNETASGDYDENNINSKSIVTKI